MALAGLLEVGARAAVLMPCLLRTEPTGALPRCRRPGRHAQDPPTRPGGAKKAIEPRASELPQSPRLWKDCGSCGSCALASLRDARGQCLTGRCLTFRISMDGAPPRSTAFFNAINASAAATFRKPTRTRKVVLALPASCRARWRAVTGALALVLIGRADALQALSRRRVGGQKSRSTSALLLCLCVRPAGSFDFQKKFWKARNSGSNCRHHLQSIDGDDLRLGYCWREKPLRDRLVRNPRGIDSINNSVALAALAGRLYMGQALVCEGDGGASSFKGLVGDVDD